MKRTVLPSVLTVGFTGHRSVPDEASARRAITALLKEIKAGAPGVVCGLSSVAAGGDLLFAEACLALGLPLCVLLPLPAVEFRADFDAPTWERVERVLAQVTACEVTGANGGSREESYYECGVQTVARSDVVVALWNGQPSQGLGGTAQIVDFARAEDRPVYWLHSQTGVLERLGCEHALDRDAELDFLNDQPDSPGVVADDASSEALVRAWFEKIDASATAAAPRVRRIATLPILLTAAAAILSTISSFVEGSLVPLALGTALGLAAGVLPKMLHAQERQTRWARLRTAAEVCRSFLAFWRAPGAYSLIGPEVVPELGGTLSALNFLKVSAKVDGALDLEAFRARYRSGRVREQLQYFARYASEAQRKARQYAVITAVCIVIALAVNLWALAGKLSGAELMPGGLKPVIELAGTVFFQVATIVGALLAMYDYNRRRQRYREMERLLQRWDRQLEFAATWPALLRIAGRIERALLAEIIEWRSLIRHRKLTQR